MIPDMMTVAAADGVGAPEVLKLATRPVPQPEPTEILIKVATAGVNGPDLVQRRGHYPPPPGASDLLGLEVSGEVVAIGDEVTSWRVGEQVCALTNGGGYAEYVAVTASHALPLPATIGLEDAGGLPETYFTVWSNCFQEHQPAERSIFLVHGGAGGIGSTAIQLGAALGLRVFTTAATEDDCAFCQSLGAERAINFQAEDFVGVVKEAGGASLILDIVGGEYIARNIKAARHDARIIQLAFNQGSQVDINLMPIMLKRLTYTGSTLRSRPTEFKTRTAQDLQAKVWPLFTEGKLKPVSDSILPLAQAAAAHTKMEASGHRGKILLRP